jgi:hypothetical protein
LWAVYIAWIGTNKNADKILSEKHFSGYVCGEPLNYDVVNSKMNLTEVT